MNRPGDDYYDNLESRLRSLFVSVLPFLEGQDADQIEEFIDHAEYGLALLVTAEVFRETEALISDADRLEVIALATTMGIVAELPAGFRTTPGAVDSA